MTKGVSGKPKTLGRLIFGEKRKQHASPSRHRSSTRNGGSVADISSAAGANVGNHRNPINLHDWAVWRMQLNEQMGAAITERRADLKQMRHFLQTNPFYQQHSRDPSTGRYNGVRLLFSIPHAKLKPEFVDGSRGPISKDLGDLATFEQNNVRPNSDDRTTTSLNSASAALAPVVIDKVISHLVPKPLAGNTGGFLHINEQMVAVDTARARRTVRGAYTACDRVHSTLQKAVKDGNVLEKIKAFEMQAAAAAQAEAALKLGTGLGTTHRMQSLSSSIQSATQRTLSPSVMATLSPMPTQHQQQTVRSSRGRYIHPTQQRRPVVPVVVAGHESRKGAHVLEPAHGDIILKRRTPSQKAANEEDYSMTAMSSAALSTSQSHHRHHHHHPHQHRANASRSRHRQEIVQEKRTPVHHENVNLKQKGSTPTPKSSSRRRWLKGRKETTPSETPVDDVKQEPKATKPGKSSKNKKKQQQQQIVEGESTDGNKKTDNNRVYGVPNAVVANEPPKLDSSSSQPPARIQEESESEREKHVPNKESETILVATETIPLERRLNKKQHHQKLSSTDGEILSKLDDDTRFSRPTDDHAHRSEMNDEDDEGKSEEDVFIDEPAAKPAAAIVRHQSVLELPVGQQSNVLRRRASQCSVDELISSDRRWQWSKESGGLIDTGSRKKKKKPQEKTQPQPITIITRKNPINQDETNDIDEEDEDEDQIVYEPPHSEQTQTPICNTHTLKKKHPFHPNNSAPNVGTNSSSSNNNKQISKQILHAIMNSMNNTNKETSPPSTNDEFFENGPHSNPEETMANITAPA